MKQPILFQHKASNPELRYTIAYNFVKDGDTLTIRYGIAQCNALDTFNRAEGREIAAGRLLSGSTSGLYAGKFNITDHPGLSVSKQIQTRFEAMRHAVRVRRGKK